MARSGTPVLETLGLFVIVYTAQLVIDAVGSSGLFGMLFVLSLPLEVNPWTIVTSVYAHAGPNHLLSNSVGLILFGWPIARATSIARFHTFFVLTGAIAGVSHVLAVAHLPVGGGPGVGVLGASGAVFALMGYFLVSNRVSDTLADRIAAPFWLTAIVFVVLAVAITVASGTSEAAFVAHFVGFLLGLFAGRAGAL